MAGLDVLDIFWKACWCRGGWNPDLIAVEIAHDVHVGVIGEGVLGDEIDVGAYFCW